MLEFIDNALQRPSYTLLATFGLAVVMIPFTHWYNNWRAGSNSRRYKKELYRRIRRLTVGLHKSNSNYASYDAARECITIFSSLIGSLVLAIGMAAILGLIEIADTPYALLLHLVATLTYMAAIYFFYSKLKRSVEYLNDMTNPLRTTLALKKKIDYASADLLSEDEKQAFHEAIDLLDPYIDKNALVNDDLRKVLDLKPKIKLR